MIELRAADSRDIAEILSTDTYIPKEMLLAKIDRAPEQVRLIRHSGATVGVLRYGFLWDYIPYLCFLNIRGEFRGRGYAGEALRSWENEMARGGHDTLFCSIPSDDAAQAFYRKMGYEDAGSLCIRCGRFAQPAEIFFIKFLTPRNPGDF
ncbi:GNAT family N-acetyltransferase [Cloacibacillus sp. An23]|uniref:GNAT family N-acetyltransferase n=1 Tax=Cloacibacillus sp. An23 TaxID=1965591 RepID=UPI000B3A7F53|nr:GNAT family N-acetyltransferase [Cloacibacillus sp. An23]OUO95012.1 hypothetical protein B5F39_00305 [Cloacibacillus sp. An23]